MMKQQQQRQQRQRQAVATSTLYQPHQLPLLHHHLLPPPSSADALHPLLAAGSHYNDPSLLSVGYLRALQWPVQQRHHHHQHHSSAAQQQAAAEQTQLSPLAASAAAGPYHHPNFQSFDCVSLSHHTRAQGRARLRQQREHSIQQRSIMDDQRFASGQQGMSEEELADFQKLSNEHAPEATGPLVGQRQASTAITSEYASADPIYQAKTAALPQKYSHYRTVRGDGNCGWRAVAYGYFEALIHHADTGNFAIEEARLRSMKNVIQQAGFDPMLIDDFADETYDLLRHVAEVLSLSNADVLLLDKFNDEMLQNYIITYLKTLTAAWMKTHEENYAPWLLGQTVTQYCDAQVLPVNAEIDHVGLMALKDVLLSPAGMSLEVLYLDRSEGSEVTMHRFDPVDNGGFTIGRVRLLYRPGHYDILYKLEDLPVPPPMPVAVPTHLQYASQNHEPVYDLGVSDFMTAIPGMSYANPSNGGWMSSSYGSGADFFGSPAAVQACTPAAPTQSTHAPRSQGQTQPVFIPATTPAELVLPPMQMPHELAIRTSVPQTSVANPDFQHQLSGGPFRPSVWQFDSDFMQATSQTPFQTSIFRNSHFNTAHFLNPDFQPEQWDPEDDYATASSSSTSSKSLRHKFNE